MPFGSASMARVTHWRRGGLVGGLFLENGCIARFFGYLEAAGLDGRLEFAKKEHGI